MHIVKLLIPPETIFMKTSKWKPNALAWAKRNRWQNADVDVRLTVAITFASPGLQTLILCVTPRPWKLNRSIRCPVFGYSNPECSASAGNSAPFATKSGFTYRVDLLRIGISYEEIQGQVKYTAATGLISKENDKGMPRKKTSPIVGDLCSFCQKEEELPLLGALVKTDEFLLHSNCIVSSFHIFKHSLVRCQRSFAREGRRQNRGRLYRGLSYLCYSEGIKKRSSFDLQLLSSPRRLSGVCRRLLSAFFSFAVHY